jgi:thiol-disulfide isomerase/thioredoxin
LILLTLRSLTPAICAAMFFAALPATAIAAALDDVAAVPHLDSAGREGYRDFLDFDRHRAFAIAPGGAWYWKGGVSSAESAEREALQACRENSDQACVLYAVDDRVVFDSKAWSRLWGPYLDRAQASRAHAGLNRGERFYDLAFRDAAGKPIALSDLQGKVVVLHFWGSWCPPCRKEMPELQQLQRALGTSPDVRMVLLQVQEDFDVSRKWTRQQHLNLPLFDSGVKGKGADTLTLADGKKIRDRDIAPAFPTTYILDKHGIVVFSSIGPVSRWSQYLPLLRDVAARSGR